MKVLLILLFFVSTVFAQINDQINDQAFVRRAYLNIVGRIPTYEEYNQYVGSSNVDKKNRLIDKLADSEGYVSHWSNFWFDLLRVKSKINEINYFSGELYADYIRASVRRNKPYNEFVRDLLTANGKYVENPSSGYAWRDVGMPLDSFIGSTRLFLGINTSCAQCHNSRAEEWSQLDFYQGVAFFSQASLDRDKYTQETINNVSNLVREQESPDLAEQVKQFLEASASQISFKVNQKTRLPKEYKYDDAKANQVVEPKPLFGEFPLNNKDKRQDFVDWIESTEYFGQNIANRVYAYIFGVPLVNENDLMAEENTDKLERLKKYGERIKALNYDLKEFTKELYKSEEFSALSFKGKVADFNFSSPLYRRLTAAQLWDSVFTLVVKNPDEYQSKLSEKERSVELMDFNCLEPGTAISNYKAWQNVEKERFKDAPKWNGYLLIRTNYITDFGSQNAKLLKQFGRTDRTLINKGSLSGSVTQTLVLLNGPLGEMINDPKLKLMQEVGQQVEFNEKVEYVFVSILSRKPTEEEIRVVQDCSVEDVCWALLNSSEFKFN